VPYIRLSRKNPREGTLMANFTAARHAPAAPVAVAAGVAPFAVAIAIAAAAVAAFAAPP
jgi:hypothetical protein